MKRKNYILSTMLLGFLFFAASPFLFAQQTISGSFSSNGQSRNYLGALPDNPQSPLRLVIMFCGAQENASQMVLRGFNDHLGNHSMVIYPEPASPMGFDNVNGVDDFQMVENLISYIDSIYTIDTADICLGGFSNGAIFTYNLACEFNDPGSTRAFKFKSIAIVSGAMETGKVNTTDCPVANELPVIAFHGLQDPVIQYNGGPVPPPVSIMTQATESTIDFWATTINGCSANPTATALPDLVTETPTASTVERLEYNCTSSQNTQLYRINGGLHAWPGGNANLDIAQSRNMDINASELIADFFGSQTTVSVSDQISDSQIISVYPNPFKDMLSVQANSTIKRVEIVNVSGFTVFTEVQPNGPVSLNQLSPGVYFLKIETEEGSVAKKIIKE